MYAAFMKERKFKPYLTRQLLNMFTLRCELGFILYFVVMQQKFFFQLVSQQIVRQVARKNAYCTEASNWN